MSEREQLPCAFRLDLDCNRECELYKAIAAKWEMWARNNRMTTAEYIDSVRSVEPLMSREVRLVGDQKRLEGLNISRGQVAQCYNFQQNIIK